MGGGASSSSGSNAFSRQGGTQQNTNWTLGGGLSNLIEGNTQYAGLDPTAKDQMVGRVSFDNSKTPYMSSLINTANNNPYSGTYEANTQAQFDNRTQKMLNLARTGQENVIAPLNRGQYYREAEVMNQSLRDRAEMLAGQRKVDAQAQAGAAEVLDRGNIGSANALADLQRSNSAALYGAVDPLSTKNTSNNDNYTGQGQQTSFAYGSGVNLCCWIFMEAYHGKMPWYVRACRDEFAPEDSNRRKGYVWMSKWLVPCMRKSAFVRTCVWTLMVHPLSEWGRWYKSNWFQDSYRTKEPKTALCVKFWFTVWSLLGRFICR